MKELVNSMRNPQRLQLKAFFPIHQRRHAKPVNSRRTLPGKELKALIDLERSRVRLCHAQC